jgi:hypothetical protein
MIGDSVVKHKHEVVLDKSLATDGGQSKLFVMGIVNYAILLSTLSRGYQRYHNRTCVYVVQV